MVKSGCKINGANQSSDMKDTLDGLQCLNSAGAAIAKTTKWHYYEKFADIPPDKTVVQRPVIHHTDGKRKDAAGG